MNRIDVKRIVVLILLMQAALVSFAQMSDEQVVSMLKEARDQGKSQEEMIVLLSQRGVTREQLERIRANYTENTREEVEASGTTDRARTEVPVEATAPQRGTAAVDRVFGREVFNSELLTFEPNLNIATPNDYVLGPGDEVIIDIWGDSKQTLRQQIAPDGTITDPQMGPIVLNGLSVEEANARLSNAYSRIYSTMNGASPTTYMKMSLGEIRSIRVNIMGEVVVPGTYTLPSLASLFHALYSAGGVNNIGSLRDVKVNRGGKQIANVDVYEYLLHGRSDLDIRLEDGDVIIVSPYQNLVSIGGKVKRPLIYEMADEETLATLLDFAGGFTGDAYKKAVRVVRKSGREYQVFNVEEGQFASFALTDGDEITVGAVLDRFENRVEIRGAVYRAGMYALDGNVSTVRQLIEKAEGVREDAFLDRAVLYRDLPNTMREAQSVDIKKLLANEIEDITLRKNDVLYIPSIFDLNEELSISVRGAVGNPGTFRYVEGMSLEDVIVQAGGLRESASVVKIDVARRIKNPKSTETTNTLAENFTLTLKDGLVIDGQEDFVIQPFDEIFVRTSPGYQVQQSVTITGEVLFAGEYVLSEKGERLSDLVKKAGGVNPDAYIAGARLVRQMNEFERRRVESILRVARQSTRDSVDLSSIDFGNDYYVGIDLGKALENPGSEYDVVLREGDRLIVPEYAGTVKITGGVMYPNTVVYEKGSKLKHYIEQGGGVLPRAKKNRSFIVYMNGTVSKSKVFAKAKPAPGCEIIVPVKPERKGAGLAEIMTLATSTTSIAALVTSILNNTK